MRNSKLVRLVHALAFIVLVSLPATLRAEDATSADGIGAVNIAELKKAAIDERLDCAAGGPAAGAGAPLWLALGWLVFRSGRR